MKTVTAFVEDPRIIHTMTDAKIRLIAKKVKRCVNRSPNRSAYNSYVREQMRRLVESERTGDSAATSPREKFRQIAQQWSEQDNPYKCSKTVSTALKNKHCPQCPSDQNADGWRRVQWGPLVSAESPTSVGDLHMPAPTRPSISPPPSFTPKRVHTTPSSTMRCHRDTPVYCNGGPKQKNRGWCVKTPGDCDVPIDLLTYTRKRCNALGTGDECSR